MPETAGLVHTTACKRLFSLGCVPHTDAHRVPVVIPGSHRASFALPADVKEMEACEDWLREVPVKAGDCVRRR